MANKPVIVMQISPKEEFVAGTRATFQVWFQGVREGQKIELAVYESANANEGSDERKFATIKGTFQATGSTGAFFRLIFDEAPKQLPVPKENMPNQRDPSKPVTMCMVAFRFGPADDDDAVATFWIPIDKFDLNEGESWVLQLAIDSLSVRSSKFTISRVRRQVAVNDKATYDYHVGNKIEFFHDGSKGPPGADGAFQRMKQAISEAKRFIFIADWSFHPYFRINRTDTSLEATIGRILAKKAEGNKDMVIAIHTWDHTNLGSADEQNDWGERRMNQTAGGSKPANLLWRKSSRTGFGYSHHQKFVVCDCPNGPDGKDDVKVFFGGLDITKGRFDWPDHPIGPDANPSNPTPPFKDFLESFKAGDTFGSETYDDWYSAEFTTSDLPREPWHDIYGCLQGPTAWSVVEEFVGRWLNDPASTGAGGDTNSAAIAKVRQKFNDILDSKKEANLTRQYEGKRPLSDWPWTAQVYRSLKKEHWAQAKPIVDPQGHSHLKWTLKRDYERSIQDAYEQAIDQADKFIYIETQYFIGSGKLWRPTKLAGMVSVANDLPERIVKRIQFHRGNGDDFHAYIFTPMYPEGNPADHGPVAQREYEWQTMEYMIRALGDGWEKYLTFGFIGKSNNSSGVVTQTPDSTFTSDTDERITNVKANKRYMIYIHSKLIIVDDRFIMFGSANLNERSLNGARDSEICIGMWPAWPKVEQACIDQLKAFREELFTEHLGHGPSGDPWTSGCVSDVQKTADANYKAYRTGTAMTGHLMRWPLKMVTLPDGAAAYDPKKYDFDNPPTVPFEDTVDSTGPWLRVDGSIGSKEGDDFLPDSPNKKDEWKLWSPGNWLVVGKEIPE